jgi:ankyrin repeat protein
MLYDKGADLESPDSKNWTILHNAFSFADITSYLIKLGADKEKQTLDGATPLILAAFSSKPSVVKVLLDAGAMADHLDIDGRTALDYAESQKDDESIKLLRAALEKMNHEDSPLTTATREGSPNEIGVDVDP